MKTTAELRAEAGTPDFLIVGAMKAGTTTLAKQLRAHPEIGVARREVHYFCMDHFYERGPKWYAERLNSGLRPGIRLIGEKSVDYSHFEKAAGRIRSDCPDTKLLWMLRNPVDRTYSHYLHFWKRGKESRPFAEAVRTRRNRYLRWSDYPSQITRFLHYFPREQMHFTLLDELKEGDGSHLESVLEFLGARDTKFSPPIERANATAISRYRFVLHIASKWMNPKGETFRRLELLLRPSQPGGYEPMDPETRAYLVKYFRPQTAALGPLIGRELSHWNR